MKIKIKQIKQYYKKFYQQQIYQHNNNMEHSYFLNMVLWNIFMTLRHFQKKIVLFHYQIILNVLKKFFVILYFTKNNFNILKILKALNYRTHKNNNLKYKNFLLEKNNNKTQKIIVVLMK
ncbi:hypothetical protein IMG5_176220 [Ichthyophthirius multifiliis]|uniref:Transmembrane protein n=1 Tax=Ichthyophthirius multifiliis TaxID=5932 RepID=G0R2A2_ICHMU|nr:hypothetical protein IMG5_176220 [Ichthyophthirius multifiliis]EGR28405.1 hypothetical protein IMG5_176220 [Ichthyophthirius multifiliis]|eukprot:XP_004028000.1 hypothetical protein IMG5_176220 [Ichthyophthirius multifiliis]